MQKKELYELAEKGELTGVFYDISSQDYHAGPGLSATQLKALDDSAKKYKALIEEEQPSTEALKDGRFYHAVMLEPGEVEKLYYPLSEKVDRRTKAGKIRWAEILDEAGDREIVESAKVEKIEKIRESLFNDPMDEGEMVSLFAGAKKEVTVYWYQDEVLCKARADLVHEKAGIIADLKFVDECREYAAERKATSYKFDIQAAHYIRGFSESYSKKIDLFGFIYIEKSTPYDFMKYSASLDMIGSGESKIYNAILKLKEAQKTGFYPGYPKAWMSLDVYGG